MLGAVSGWFERRRRRRAAITVAVRHFEATTGGKALPAISSVIGDDARGTVVRVCFGTGQKPPRRAWYVVDADGVVVAELSFAEARRFGEDYWK
jgi:hypothetical protein